MHITSRCGKLLGAVLFLWIVYSPLHSAYSASPASDSAALVPDQAMEEKILQHIQYGTPIQAEDAEKSAVAEKASDNSSAKADVSDYPPEYGTGEIHIKLRPGWKLDRADHVTRITKEGQIQYPEELLYLDYEFPDSSIEPLWGPAEPLLELKTRGEKLSGQSLPDLSLWYSIKPDPTLPPVKMIGKEEVDSFRLPRFMEEATRRTVDILRTMPGVESVRVAAPMVRSNWPSMFASANPDWTPFQLHTAPDVYYLDGDVDYGTHALAVSDLVGGNYDLGFPYPYQGLACSQSECSVGGLNVWPAWDAPSPFKGEGVAIGYIEEDWCLSPLNDGDFDNDYEVKCPTHPDLQAFHDSTHIKYLTSERTPHLFSYWHGTSVLGIMAADHNSTGSMGIAPNADYYIGYAWNTQEWIAIAQRIIGNGQGNGALFTEPPFVCFNSDAYRLAACPVEVHPEYFQFVRTLTANNFVVVTVPGNGYWDLGIGVGAGVNLDKPIDIDGDFEGNQFDYDNDNVIDGINEIDNYEGFDYPDGFLDYEANGTGSNGYQSLDRASPAYIDSGSILVAAGTAQDWANPHFSVDTLYFPRRSRETWSSYGSRVDVQARGSADVSPISAVIPDGDPDPDERDEPITPPTHMYNYFSGTSACLPQITSLAALAQQMYKTLPLKTGGQTGDFLTSIRMRNALVENGNPQAPLDVDPNWVHFPNELNGPLYNHNLSSNSFFKSGLVPSYLESPAEPFARIGPRPDLGRIMYAFGLADENGSPISVSNRIPRYKLAFENHQYTTAPRLFCVHTSVLFPDRCTYIVNYVPVFIPNEPFANNYVWPITFNTAGWAANLVRSPRIAGGFALNLGGTPSTDRSLGRYLQVQDSQGFDSSYFHPTGSNGVNFTVSSWAKVAQTTGAAQYIFYKQSPSGTTPNIVEYGMYIDSGMHFCFAITLANATTPSETCSSSTLALNQVYHLAAIVTQATSNQITVMPYIDGNKARLTARTFAGSALREVGAPPEIGLGFAGIIDEIVYERTALPVEYLYGYLEKCPTLQERVRKGANPPGLLASWQFDVKNAATIDDPVSDYDGTLTNPNGTFYQKWGAGVPIGDFSSVNNTTSQITVANPKNSSLPPGALANLGSQFSIEAFFKVPSSQTSNIYRLLARKLNDTNLSYELYLSEARQGANHAYTFTFSAVNSSGSIIQANSRFIFNTEIPFPVFNSSWAHLILVYDGVSRQISMYLNSKPLSVTISQNPATWGTPIDTVLAPLTISGSSSASDLKWPSEMAFVRFYSSVLNQDNVKFLYSNRSSLWQNSYYRTVVTP